MFLWVQCAIAGAVFLLFLLFAVFLTKREHAEQGRWRVIIGAALEGAIVGSIAAFLLFPGYVSRVDFHLMTPAEIFTLQAQAVLLPSFIVMEFVRNGGLSAVPGFSFFARPRRRALLLRRKAAIEHQIAKMDARRAPAAAAEPEATMAPA